uniref:Uncharacterized protein ycf35 n=1 Tax=Polysiphonia sp. TaxID=1967842 RepID=A0A1Z1M3Z4_9FLOR|nr:hypothetical protein [Polysiphonia sp.]
MSHFSKIKTNITNLDILTKTINQLGFNYRFIYNRDDDLSKQVDSRYESLCVYHPSQVSSHRPIFLFKWNGNDYNLVVDLQLWDLEIDFNYVLDCLFQQYAYNTIVNTSSVNGFHKINERLNYDGSIKITLQRWNDA